MARDAWTPERLDALSEFWGDRLVLESAALDVYGQLAQGPLTAAELAGRLGLEPRATRLFMDALVALHLLRRDGDRYSNSQAAGRYLVTSSPDYRGHRLIAARDAWSLWSKLADALRTGQPQRDRPIFKDDPEASHHLLRAIHRNASEHAARIVENGALDLTARRTMLDVGGGAGTYSIAFCRANPALQATLVDRPIAAALAREMVDDAGLSDRIAIRELDLDEGELGGRYDLVWLSNVLHGRGESANRALVRQLCEHLEPDGILGVQDLIMEEGRTRPVRGAIFSVHMLLNNGVGRCYTFDEVRGWLEAAGLREIRWIRDHEQLTLVTGKR